MFHRLTQDRAQQALRRAPAAALLGARQVGKTTLARQIAAATPGAVYLDLELEDDRAKLSQPSLFFRANRDRLVVLDEVQRVPNLFDALRPEIDADRRPGRFLLLGSASPVLLKQTSESLAGRLELVDMTPLLAMEIHAEYADLQSLWLRGGFPASFTAVSDEDSLAWRRNYIRLFVERDLPQLGVTIPAPVLERFWRMLAHQHGQLLNASQLGSSLGASHHTARRYLDILIAARVARQLEPLHANLGKRLVKAPKVYVADSGLLHALLNLGAINDLMGHPIAGHSWEGFVLEQIVGQAPSVDVAFYRTAAGAELDVVLTRGRKTIGFEIKFSAAPKPGKGFWQAITDLGLERAYVVAPVPEGYPLAENVEVLPAHRVHTALG